MFLIINDRLCAETPGLHFGVTFWFRQQLTSSGRLSSADCGCSADYFAINSSFNDFIQHCIFAATLSGCLFGLSTTTFDKIYTIHRTVSVTRCAVWFFCCSKYKRYFYCHDETGVTRWDYPEVDEHQSSDIPADGEPFPPGVDPPLPGALPDDVLALAAHPPPPPPDDENGTKCLLVK